MQKSNRLVLAFILAPVVPSLLAALYFHSAMVLGFGLFVGFLIMTVLGLPVYCYLHKKQLTNLPLTLSTAIVISAMPYILIAFLDGFKGEGLLIGVGMFALFGLLAGLTFWMIARPNQS